MKKPVNSNKGKVNRSWRIDEAYTQIKGKWCYLYRAVDSGGDTIDFWISSKQDMQAAEDFFNKSLKNT